jgi:hypothetical protein
LQAGGRFLRGERTWQASDELGVSDSSESSASGDDPNYPEPDLL